MDSQAIRFQRILLVILGLLFVLTLVALIYPELAASGGNIEWWMLIVNLLLLSIPLLLLYGSIYLLVIARREVTLLGQVTPRLGKVIFWAPRIAAIVLIVFISLFSLDVFDTAASPLELLGALLIHNLPSLVLLALLILAWKRPAVGFVAFLVIGLLFVLFFVRSIFAISNLVIFVLPILLIAGLFYADWKWVKTPQPTELPA